ncbi:epoxide hydrolase family protein [Rhodococcus sp. IEGM 1307]|uniref:epoxide hydrolase family protein n=1 Tax=Rhodococcus sp. IEGM 1307 TaxID=3047091 RepID=UPI0024B63D85|nr:epoxide hydrolase family protein [Rhodococcus sp. IEGM 1307]MDI9979788.1 epoxide hydrolase [Rhodococcus sp. IEGM 1307]
MWDNTIHPEPYAPRAAQADLMDLRSRLRATRWPQDAGDAGWALGTDLAYLRELVEYWAEEFDWTAQESALAALPRFQVRLSGMRIHFVHVRAAKSSVRALPLVLSHGWPDSFWRYAKVIPLLVDPSTHGADPDDAFDVVVPDLPGFGYSDGPVGPPLNSLDVAGLWAQLMTILGYETFGAAGGDVGSQVSRYLALDYPERVVGVHRMDAGLPVQVADGTSLTHEEREWFKTAAAWGASEGAYGAMHRTKPNTAAVGLTDSPAGLAAWMVEKLRAWSDCGGDIEQSFTKDEMLTNITLYWLTESIGSSMRMYRANAEIPLEQQRRRVEVPSGFSLFRGDIVLPPRSWLERTANVVRVSEPARGGHFAPFEEPELYAQELRDFFRPYRTARGR